jgi:hypothetical protein
VNESWQAYLASTFPGYLLPESAQTQLSVAEAAQFLAAISGRADSLEVLRAASLLSPRVQELLQLVTRDLVELARGLPSRTDLETRHWQGGFRGKLHLPQTLALHAQGDRTRFVTQSRVRTFDLPENILVRAVCTRLVSVLKFLREAGVLPSGGWGPGLRDCEGALQHLLLTTKLREVSSLPITGREVHAAREARVHTYRRCAEWWLLMQEGLDDDRPETIAEVVANGALLPLAESTRFELAVVIRLAEALERELLERSERTYRLERGLVVSGREDMFTFVVRDVKLRLYYNQSILPTGPVETSARHYLSNTGRFRPDITLVYELGGKVVDAVVFECKLSENASYVLSGLHEAVVYRHEYAEWLRGWPKAVLVSSASVQGTVRREDEVIAVGWERWLPLSLAEHLIDRLHSMET